MKKVFCITGVSGQDGSYSAEILVELGCNVIGLTRKKNPFQKNLGNILSSKNFRLIETNYSQNSLKKIIKENNITHIMNFCGQSYVSKSWEMIEETIFSKSLIVSRLLNIIKESKTRIRLINACSSEIFDESKNLLNEESNLSPCNPYGCSQLLAFSLIKSIRNYSNIWACSAILFPHESLRRDENFLFMRILNQIDNIHLKSSKYIKIGNSSVIRDWGFAVDFVYFMLLILLSEKPKDFCICTGEGNSVRELVESICSEYGMSYEKHIQVDKALSRSYEPHKVVGNNSKLINELQVSPPLKMRITIKHIIENRKRLFQENLPLDKITDFLDQKKLSNLEYLLNK